MRGGLAGWIASVLILLPFVAAGTEAPLFIDGVPAVLSSPLVVSEGTAYAPLTDLAPAIGVEVVRATFESVTLRWNGGRADFPASRFPVFSGETYVSIDWLIAVVGGRIHRIGEELHVDTSVAGLVDLEASEEEVLLRFDGFVPQEVAVQDESTIRILFHHCRIRIPPQSIILAGGRIDRVDLASIEPGGCELTLSLSRSGPLRVRRFESSGFYSVSIEIGDESYFETVTEMSGGIAVHEVRAVMSGGETELAYVTVDDWRRDYRLRPGISPAGVGRTSPLTEIAAGPGAIAAIGGGSSLDLFVLDGIPYALGSGTGEALGFDLFGRPYTFSASVSVAFCAAGVKVPLDGVNRPLTYGEAVAYSPGYTSEIARGVPGSFTVIKLRDGRVVSIFDGPFVSTEPTAAFVVASGEARGAFSSISLGDRAKIETDSSDDGTDVIDAIGIVGVLFEDGNDLSPSIAARLGSAAGEPLGWDLVCTDWYGGLILLSVNRDPASAGATLSDLAAYLRSLSSPVRGAFILNAGRSGGVVCSDSGSYCHLVSGERVAAALCLVPVER